MDQVKATISPGYRWRLLLISLAMLGFGAYCVYDWQIGYPKMVEKYQTYEQIKQDHPNDHPRVWKEKTEAEGWNPRVPKKKTDRDVFTQLIMALIVLPIGFYFVFKFIRENGRWVAMGQAGLTASGGRAIPWVRMEDLDETRWKTKGIAWLNYRDEQGQARKLLLDDFKSEREPIKQIVQRVQQHLYPERLQETEAAAAELAPTTPSAGLPVAAGQVYLTPDETGQYQVTKVLAVDEQAVHLRSYEQRFAEPTGDIDTSGLTVAIGHMPLALESFAPPAELLIRTEPVAEDELEGYRIWAGQDS